MKNIHVIPSDKPSRLLKTIPKGNLLLSKKHTMGSHWENKNIYITNDVEIKEGDCFLHPDNTVERASRNLDGRGVKKIILTTDQNLIKDGVQAIDDKFLEWFVKNPSCEFVKIVDDVECLPMPNIHIHKRIYKIIIAQEKPKQEKCCTPAGQIKRYVDCVGCDKKPKQMSKQTAVEWVIEQYINKNRGLEVFMKAIQMEKEQITEAFKEGNLYHGWALKHEPEQYYNETYKKEDK